MQVCSVLTSYNKLADFVPNLDLCERMPGAPPGKQRLRQRACSQSLYWRLQAEAILDLQMVERPLGRRELHFTMVEGDFQVSADWRQSDILCHDFLEKAARVPQMPVCSEQCKQAGAYFACHHQIVAAQ